MSGVIEKIGVVGAGVMGRGIAQLAAQSGCRVLLHDAKPGAAPEARDFAVAMLQRAAEKGRMTEEAARAASERILSVSALSEMAGCDLVIEAIVEKLKLKQALFGELESLVRDDTVLATNTSSLSVAAIAGRALRPERIAGLHFFNPVPLMRLVEVVSAPRTAPAVAEALTALVGRFGHQAVQARDFPGFLVNHAGRAFVTEGLQVIEEGICAPAVLDKVMREAAGFRMGPCELLDLTGLDVSVPAMEEIFNRFHGEPRLRPPALGRARLEGGLLGRKVGEGFYRYDKTGARLDEAAVDRLGEPPSALPDEVAVMAEGDAAGCLRQWVERRGVRATSSPHASLVLVAPLGRDASWEAAVRRLDPAHVVGVDVLFGLDGHTTLCATPATDIAAQRAALALARAGGNEASLIRDSAGLLCQRILAMIVNVGCEIAQKGIGAPADIDLAVRLGLGYPRGPLEWGDAIGPKTVLTVLEGLQDITGDPRYRPSPWLRRRAALGLSLLHPGS